jgi:uncharacterized protein (DUF697 family)
MMKALKQARAAFSMLNPEEMRRRAGQEIHIGLVASNESGYCTLEDFLVPPDLPRETRAQVLRRAHRVTDRHSPAKVDLVLYEPGLRPDAGSHALHRHDSDATITEILRAHDDLTLALARLFPGFRKQVIDRTIQAVARENALFAIAAALPDVVPSLFELPWAFGEFASDTVFLTANQVRMAFIIAAACGDEIGFAQQKGSIAAIVAGAFGWRALARELVGKVPFGGGLIPKGAIAYAATYAVGKGLERLHANHPFTAVETREVYEQAYQQGLDVARSLRERA